MKDSKYDGWSVKSAIDSLRRSEEIMRDKKMLKLIQAELKKQAAEQQDIEKKVGLELKVKSGLKKVFGGK